MMLVKIHITASSAKRVPVRASPEKFLQEHLYPRFHGNAATRYGKESELVASQWLEGCGYSVSRRGTVVSAEEPWLSASPDGVLNTEELLEIKCPVLGKSFESLEDLFSSNGHVLHRADRIEAAHLDPIPASLAQCCL